MAAGPFQPTMDSLKKYQCPEWFRDAKFGIWAHWGPQAVPMDGDWYARGMYEPGNKHYKYHLEHYGHPSEFGYKDIIPLWELRVIPKVMEMVGEIIHPLLEEMKPFADQQGMTIERQLPGAIVLKGDTALLKIAYRNLLDIALKYGKKGGRIRLACEEKNGAFHFEVWNEGKGLTSSRSRGFLKNSSG